MWKWHISYYSQGTLIESLSIDWIKYLIEGECIGAYQGYMSDIYITCIAAE